MTIKQVTPWLPHYSERALKFQGNVDTIVLHHDAAGSGLGSINYLRGTTGKNRASYHYMIERDGLIYKCVPSTKRAWHAGVSRGPHGADVNSYSLGICLSNWGGFEGRFETYPDVQVKACTELINTLIGVFPLKWITTHRLITNRKVDPARFDFKEYAKNFPTLTPWRDESLNRDWNDF